MPRPGGSVSSHSCAGIIDTINWSQSKVLVIPYHTMVLYGNRYPTDKAAYRWTVNLKYYSTNPIIIITKTMHATCWSPTGQRPVMTSTLSHAINRPGANVRKGSDEEPAIKSFKLEAPHVGDLGCFVFMASCGVVRIFLQSL